MAPERTSSGPFLDRETLERLFGGHENLTKLDEINLVGKGICQIADDTFAHLSNVKTLNMNFNKLKSIDAKTFQGLCNLESLFLFWNEISHISPDAFGHLVNLKQLNLAYNKVKRIEGRTFRGLDNLEVLHLSANEMCEIGGEAFASLGKLKHLELRENMFQSIEENVFQHLKNLEVLDLFYNETTCLSRKHLDRLESIKIVKVGKDEIEKFSFYDGSKQVAKYKPYKFTSEWQNFLQQFPA